MFKAAHARSVIIALVASSTALIACGDDTPREYDYGSPPNSPYDTGYGGGDGYGSGYGNAPTGPTTPPTRTCPDELKRCATVFTYPAGSEVAVELRGNWAAPGSWDKGVPMAKSGGNWVASVPLQPGVRVEYKFCINPKGDGTCAEWRSDATKPTEAKDGNNVLESVPMCSEPLCEDEAPPPPAGVFDWRDASIYFVFVDRFFDGKPSNNCTISSVSGGKSSIANYKGGDWAGVTAKLNEGYFTDLGVNTLWLTVPVSNTKEAGKGVGGDPNNYSAYHGYWPQDLDRAEECFGTKDELVELVQTAHAKGIKVLFDYAMVHVHISSTIYKQHPDWFWPNAKDGKDCICGNSCDWNADGKRCWFTDYLPHWNFTNSAALNYSVSNAIQWVKDTGIDGFRLDAIKHVEDAWLTTLRSRITSEVVATKTPKQRFYMVGETFDYNPNSLKYYVDPNTKLDGQFDFPARLAIVKSVLMRKASMADLKNFYDGNDGFYGASAVMSPFVGNHDIGRVIHMGEDAPMWDEWSNGDKAKAWSGQPAQPGYRRPYERLANAFAVLLTNKGAPLIYYGDEYGLAGAGDPDNRRPLPWNDLSADQLYVRSRVKALLAARNAHPALRRGMRQTLFVNDNVWAYSMTASDDTVYVAVNRGDSDETVSGLPAVALNELLENKSVNGGSVVVPARQARVFVRK